jgi:peptidoglycan/xylan/chitin deacetylase (PgdA/CDA1 family)
LVDVVSAAAESDATMTRDRAPRPLVLAYHAVSSTWQTPLAVPEATLRAQLEHLRDQGYVGLRLSDAERHRRNGTLPSRSLVVTFDDGYASTLRAAPILASLGFPGTVFLVTNFVDTGSPLSWPGMSELWRDKAAEELHVMSWDHAAELKTAGWEVGSHTKSHPLLTQVDDDRLRRELEESREEIERRLGSCTSVAYPFGVADERVAAAAAAAGYEVGCMLTFAHFVDEPFRRPRIGLTTKDARLRLAIQVSGFGQAIRRSVIARTARRLRPRRPWLSHSGLPG